MWLCKRRQYAIWLQRKILEKKKKDYVDFHGILGSDKKDQSENDIFFSHPDSPKLIKKIKVIRMWHVVRVEMNVLSIPRPLQHDGFEVVCFIVIRLVFFFSIFSRNHV